MRLRLLEIITSIQWIKPRIQEKPCPFPILHDEAPLTQPFPILRQYQIDTIAFQIAKCFDYAVGRDHGLLSQHDFFQRFGGEDVRAEVERRIHDEGVRGKGEEVGAVWVEG